MSISEQEQCFQANSHGAGFAYIENGIVKYKKGLMNIGDFKTEYAKINILPHVVHFRISTCRVYQNNKVIKNTDALLTHPFITGRTNENALESNTTGAVLFHNGVWLKWTTVLERMGLQNQKDEFSDTRLVAYMLDHLDSRKSILNMADGKYVMMSAQYGIEIFGDEGWIEEDGIKFSNSSYKQRAYLNNLGWNQNSRGVWQEKPTNLFEPLDDEESFIYQYKRDNIVHSKINTIPSNQEVIKKLTGLNLLEKSRKHNSDAKFMSGYFKDYEGSKFIIVNIILPISEK
jgi:hypothetical protein